MEQDLLKYFLPAGILEHFIIVKFEEVKEKINDNQIKVLRIILEEKNEIPSGYDKHQYESKGFYPPLQIKDFPIRDRAVILVVKRRRWRNKQNKREEIRSEYNFIASGSKITRDLSDFLK